MKSRIELKVNLEHNTYTRAKNAFANQISEVQSPQQVSIPLLHTSDIQIGRARAHILMDRNINFTENRVLVTEPIEQEAMFTEPSMAQLSPTESKK